MSIAGPAHGEEQSHARWVYEAPRGCPSQMEVDRALRARVPASALESDPRTFVIQIEEHDGSFVGRLTFSNDVGERVVEERTCEEVVDALLVFTTIALDPSRSPVQTGNAAPAPPSPSRPPPVAPSSPGPRSEAPKPPPRRRLPATLGFGAGAGITSGPVPAPAPVFTLGATFRQPFSAERGVMLRLGAKATRGEKDVSSGRLDAYLVAGQVEVAPTITWRSLSFSGGPGVTLGVLSATGQDISAARQSSAFWADVGAVLRAGVSVGGIRFEGYASGAAALTPRTYMLQRPFGEREVHATSPFLVAVGGELAIELGRGL
ncbi:MAG: hypothetical protein BGO98_12135 [Myxococcales bacterium 68-20]|nr:MAG: hypothetical protein BGO98_12135 [Myxococcales bacterium 68-20]